MERKGAESIVDIFNLDSTPCPLSEVPRIALDRTTISAIISGLRIWSSSQCAHKCGNLRAKHRVSIQTEERRRKWIQLRGLCGELWHSSRFDWEEEGPATSHCDFWQMSKAPSCATCPSALYSSPPWSRVPLCLSSDTYIYVVSFPIVLSLFPKIQQMSDGG